MKGRYFVVVFDSLLNNIVDAPMIVSETIWPNQQYLITSCFIFGLLDKDNFIDLPIVSKHFLFDLQRTGTIVEL